MDSSNLFMMLAAVILVSSLIYFNINKISDEIDEKENKNGFGKQNKNPEFEHFCDLAIREIELIADDENTAESLKESLGDFSRELRHIAKMNTNSSEQVWSQKIADVLIRLDSLLRSQGKDMLADALQHKLKSEFSKI
ncbi:hypothetical protein [Campylobacter sp.]|uniref:hypothetical protein n=1 Tax=Campylobacter sp. TaxID=205 RepID=UPI002A67E984|nr:hypothetical protein [Campylobacter sp.]MDD7703976.1 hypothetical protein [Campylobacteraceae bacterium]MDY2635588.1 hypothetical protein [Campylobacter sp.]